MSIRALKLEEFTTGLSDRVVQSVPSSGKPPAPAPEPQPDPEALEMMLAKARGKGKADGFAEGVALAEQRAESEMRMLLQAIREQIADLDMMNQTMETQITEAVGRISTALLSAIAPSLAETGLTGEITKAVSKAMREVPDGTVVIVVSPDQSARVAEALDIEKLMVRVDDDPDLGGLEARVHWQGGFDAIDLGASIAEAQLALDAHISASLTKTQAHTGIAEERKRVNE